MGKTVFVIIFILFSISIYPSDIPLIFLHGHKKQAKPDSIESGVNAGGWGTWNPQNADYSREHPSSMTDIIDEHYGGYIAGIPLNCSKDSTLSSTNGNTKVMYNYSFYREDAGRGVIGSNGILECDYICYYNDSLQKLIRVKKGEAPAGVLLLGYDFSNWPNRPCPLSGDSWAQNLADFINTVLAKTGASQVDIVTHSMGSLVTRAAMKYYGCSSKVRKLITVGAPNHYYNLPLAEGIWLAFSEDPLWMKVGDDWELSADNSLITDNVTFTDTNTGVSKKFTEFLNSFPTEGIATIAGNRGWPIPFYPNDKVVGVNQVHLNTAQFNPVIYAQHFYSGDTNEVEFSETTCKFTTEFIKNWMIDDNSSRYGSSISGKSYGYGTNDSINYWKDGALRIRSRVTDYNKSLIVFVRLLKQTFKRDTTKEDSTRIITLLYEKAFPIYKYQRGFPGDPVVATSKKILGGVGWSRIILEITDMDMMTGKISKMDTTLHIEGQSEDSSFVSLNTIGDYGSESHVTASWTTNDYAVFQKLYYKKTSSTNWSTIATLNGSARSCAFGPLSTGYYQVKIEFYLDAYTPIVGISNTFNIYYESPPPPSPLHLSGYVDPFSTKAPEGHYAHLSWVFDKPGGIYTETDSFVMFKDNNKVIPFFYDLNHWKDPVKYTYVGESHTYLLEAWYHWLPPYAYIDMYSLSNPLTLTADTVNPDTGCPYFYIKENGKYIPQNTIMHYGYSNKEDNFLFDLGNRYKYESRDNDIVNKRYKNEKSVIEAAISENEVEKNYIDKINLKAVKYDSIYNLTSNTNGEYLFWKDVYKIDSCKNTQGEDILSLVENMGDSFYMAFPGDTIYIYTGTRCCNKATASGNRNRGGGIITGAGNKADPVDKGIEPSIDIEYTGGKSWVNGGEIYPREYIYAIYNDIPLLSDSIRFVINNEVKIDYISFPKTENVKYNEIKLEFINPTLKGKNVMKQIIKEDSAYINLINGDTLYFSFPLITPANGEKVLYILETDGYYNIDNKRDKGKSATTPKSDIKFISGIVYLQSKRNIFSNYEIYNISGRQVGQGEIKTGKIKLQKLCNGIYFIKLKGKHKSETHKFELIR